MKTASIHILNNLFVIMSIAILMSLLTSCFTGVEGTSKINLSKKDIIATAPTEEDRLLSNVAPQLLKDWQTGKAFLVTDEKLRLITEGDRHSLLNPGDIIAFDRYESRMGADGGENTVLTFTGENSNVVSYVIDKPLKEAIEFVTTLDIPMVIDLDIVRETGAILKGRTLWTKTANWYDPDSTRNIVNMAKDLTHKKGRKFMQVTIDQIRPGNSFFPIAADFTAENGERGTLLMNVGNSGNESRSFSKLFSLKDPRNSYKYISDENWASIQAEEVRTGMTKEECKLSLGNPADVDMGHNYSNAVEIWYYPDGRYLRFVDGVLI